MFSACISMLYMHKGMYVQDYLYALLVTAHCFIKQNNCCFAGNKIEI